MPAQLDSTIIESWQRNSDPWIAAIRNGEIESRTLVTNAAIVETVRAYAPASAVDLGCGEGWLVRALPEVKMTGVDAIPALVEQAQATGGGTSAACRTNRSRTANCNCPPTWRSAIFR